MCYSVNNMISASKTQHKTFDMLRDVPLSRYTTLGLGGTANYFVHCLTVEDIREAFQLAEHRSLPVLVLGGGSNVIFPDRGYKGMILRIGLKGVRILHETDSTTVIVKAGEQWDDIVKLCIGNDLAGVECLSGIPGLVGATPIQNVGAYGQEVRDTIHHVKALDRATLEVVGFSNADCLFGYRESRFKGQDAHRYVILEVTFRLQRFGKPVVRYPELVKFVESTIKLDSLAAGAPALGAVRTAVLSLRKRKSMVLDPDDPNSRSVGSFFMNPVMSKAEFRKLEARWESRDNANAIPTFPAGEGLKIPAAWLVENAGFPRGFRYRGAGISSNHALAIINCGGSTKDVLNLARKIEEGVYSKFGVHLEREPVVVE